MTEPNIGLNDEFLQSLFSLRDSIDAITCAADLIPDNFDESGLAIGMMFKRLSACLNSDFQALFYDLLAVSGELPKM